MPLWSCNIRWHCSLCLWVHGIGASTWLYHILSQLQRLVYLLHNLDGIWVSWRHLLLLDHLFMLVHKLQLRWGQSVDVGQFVWRQLWSSINWLLSWHLARVQGIAHIYSCVLHGLCLLGLLLNFLKIIHAIIGINTRLLLMQAWVLAIFWCTGDTSISVQGVHPGLLVLKCLIEVRI